jgi:hypothetical protein
MPKVKWREALKSGRKLGDKMAFDIRERATQMLADLLLICERLPEKDKIMIFRNPRTCNTIVAPASIKLTWEIADVSENHKEFSKEILDLVKQLDLHGIPFKHSLLFNKDYLKAKKDQLRIRI